MSEIHLKQFTKADWEDYQVIRLEALKAHPEYFCPSRDETKFQKADWHESILNKNGAIFGLYEEDIIIGLTGIIRENNDPNSNKAYMVMSYIREGHRSKGFSKLLYSARIHWAKNQNNLKTLIIEHRDDNLASQKAHQKYKTQFIEARSQKWPDGSSSLCLVYKMDI